MLKVQAMDVLEKDRNRVLPFPKNVTVAPIVEINSIKETHQANRRGKILFSNLDWQFKLGTLSNMLKLIIPGLEKLESIFVNCWKLIMTNWQNIIPRE